MTDTDIKKDAPAQPGTGTVADVKKDKTTAAKRDAAASKPKNKEPKLRGPWMYVGPTVPSIGIQNRVYTEIPEGAQERAERMPEIGHLFIPVKEYPMANRMLREGAGYIHDAYCKVAQIRRGGDGA